MNKNLRKAMISAICMLIVGVMSLTGVTYAWFTSSNAATVTGMTFDVYSPVGGVLISDTYNTNWGYSIELEDASFENFMPVSTADTLVGGKLKFFTATVNTAPTIGKLGNEIYTEGVGDGAFFAKTLYLYNDGAETVSVNLAGTTIAFNTAGTKDNGAQNAMRLALVKHGQYDQNDAAPTLSGGDVAIYEPNATTHVDATVSGQKAYNGIIAASGVNNWFDSTDATTNSQYCKPVTTVLETTDAALTVEVEAGMCYAVTVYIWLEGQDVDCVNSVGGTNLKAELHFTKA